MLASLLILTLFCNHNLSRKKWKVKAKGLQSARGLSERASHDAQKAKNKAGDLPAQFITLSCNVVDRRFYADTGAAAG